MSATNNASQQFDRNPLHVTHLQGPVDRLPDANLRAIYERAGKILLIQRWKDLKLGEPHAFLLFETEQAASACCSRIGAVKITSDRQSSRPITASLLSCANATANMILQMWLRSQSLTPSYVTKNPPPAPPCAAFPLSCLTPLTENCGLVVQMLKEHQCGPSWWRFVAQMYVANKMWAAAQFILGTGIKPGEGAKEGEAQAGKGKDGSKDTGDDIIDISDDSMVENMSESDDDQRNDFARMQKLQKSSTSAQPKVSVVGSRNVWLPRKRANVQDARVKLGVVPAKQASKQGAEKSTAPALEETVRPASPTKEAPVSESEPKAAEAPTTNAPEQNQPSTPAPSAISPPFVPTPMHPASRGTPPPAPSTPTPETPKNTPPTVPTPLSSASESARSSTSNLPPRLRATPRARSLASAMTPTPSASVAQSSTQSSATQPARVASPDKPSQSSPNVKPSTPTPPSGSPVKAPFSAAASTAPKTSSSPAQPSMPQSKEAPARTSGASQTQQSSQNGPAVRTAAQSSTLPSGMPRRLLRTPATPRPQEPPASQSLPGENATNPFGNHDRSAPSTSEKPNDQTSLVDQRPGDQPGTKEERTSPSLGNLPESDSNTTESSQGTSTSRPKTPVRSPSTTREDLSFFGRSSSPGSLAPSLSASSLVPSLTTSSLSPSSNSSFSPIKRKSEAEPRGYDTRLKRRRHRESSKSEMTIVIEPEVSALEAEKARAAELQAEEDRVRELLEPVSPSASSGPSEFLSSKLDLADYPESVASRLLNSKTRSQRSSSPLSRRQSVASVARTPDDSSSEGNRRASSADMDPRAWKATLDENEALKMKIKVLELTLPTAETVKNELYAERKEKTQLLEVLEIERSLLIQSEALRRQSDATREEQATRIKQLEDRLADSAAAVEKAREAAQAAAEQRRKAEEASHIAEAERTKVAVLLDAERVLVNGERAALARERESRAVAESKLAATEVRLSAEQRRCAEANEMAEKERIKAKDFLDAEKAIVSAQEAKLEREREIRAEIEAKLEDTEAKLKAEQALRAEDQKNAESTLQKETTRAKNALNSERALVQSERAKLVEEQEARSKVEKQLVTLKEQLETSDGKLKASEERLKASQEGMETSQRQLATLREQLNDAELRERALQSQIANWHGQLNSARDQTMTAETRARIAEERATQAERAQNQHVPELVKTQKMLQSEQEVLLMERATLARERLLRKELEKKCALAEQQLASAANQTNELRRQLQDTQSSNEQLQTQRTLLHIARTRIQELEQAIQRVEADLDAARSAEATAKTMIQLGWGPRFESGRPTMRHVNSSPMSDIVVVDSHDQREDAMDADQQVHPFIPLMRPPRQQSFKLKRTSLPARLLKVDMPSGEATNIDLGSLPANPAGIIDLLYKSKCAGVFWDIIMDEYGAMGCFDAAEAVAAGKLKHQLQ